MPSDAESDPPRLKLYVGVVWTDDETPGQRVRYYGSDSSDAAAQLRAEHGPDATYTLYNGDDAARPRESN